MKSYNILIKDEAAVYSYTEQYFNGFAPCFDDGIYSLACCKGRKNKRTECVLKFVKKSTIMKKFGF